MCVWARVVFEYVLGGSVPVGDVRSARLCASVGVGCRLRRLRRGAIGLAGSRLGRGG